MGIVVIILWLLNPSFTRFKEFSGSLNSYYIPGQYYSSKVKPENKQEVVRRRVSNYLLWSVYEIGTADYKGVYTPTGRYIGVLMNFYKI